MAKRAIRKPATGRRSKSAGGGSPSQSGAGRRTERAATPGRRATILDRARFHGASTRPAPATPEEEALARSLADEISYAMAVVAAGPRPTPNKCSILAGVQRAFEGLRPARKRAASKKARQLLSLSPRERHRYFGSFAAPGFAAALAGPVITAERRALLRAALRARLEAQRDDIERYNRFAFHGGIPALSCKTTLQGVLSAELNQYYVERVIHQPAVLNFRWSTTCDVAEDGEWEVRRLPSYSVVASGAVGNLGPFAIDFSAFLPANPDPWPRLYEVRVTPRTKPKTIKVPGDSPGSSDVAKVQSVAVGLPSNAVRVAYVRSGSEVTRFYEDIIYRRLELHLDRLRLVEAQGGAGADEIWLYGSVIESHADEEIVAHQLPKFFRALNGDGAVASLGYDRSFHLENPTSARWPKTYTVILGVLEEDGGEDVAAMMTELWTALADWLLDDIWTEIKKFLDEIGIGVEISGSIVSTLSAIAAALTASVVGAIAGLVLSFGFGILAVVNQAVKDDFYEFQVASLVLPTNTDEYVATMNGEIQTDGTFRLVSEYLQFHHWTVPSILAYDGLVEVKLHWELTERIDLNA